MDTTKPQPPTLRAFAVTARNLSLALLKHPRCTGRRKVTCIARERARPLTRAEKRRGWQARPFYAYCVENLCRACGAYFYAVNAATVLDDLVRRAGAEADAPITVKLEGLRQLPRLVASA